MARCLVRICDAKHLKIKTYAQLVSRKTLNRYFCKNSDDKIDDLTFKSKNLKGQAAPLSDISPEAQPKVPPGESQHDRKKAAKLKLMSLLTDITVDKQETKSSTLTLAKPPKRKERKRPEENQSDISLEDKIKYAAKDIASKVVGNEESVESELLNGVRLKEKHSNSVALSAEEDIVVEEEMNKNMMSAVEAVASTVAGNSEEIQSELTKKLLSLALQREESPVSEDSKQTNIMALFEGLKIEKKEESRKANDYSSTSRPPPRHISRPQTEFKMQNVDIFGSESMNIFHLENKEKIGLESNELQSWHRLQRKELKSMVQFAPSNAFGEMIQWTEQRKHWPFPIDNEFDMGAEENVGFHEHVFLDHHLKGFPSKGPIRHFMELVVTGLSKNPYITVERKVENIEWFRQYFEEKKDILNEYGVLDDKMH